MAMSTLSMGDTESDSDMEATVNKHALQLTDSLSLTTGMTLDDLAVGMKQHRASGGSSRHHHRTNPDGDSSENDGDDDDDDAEIVVKAAAARRKRRSYGDSDKTPTQDSVNMTFSAVENGLRDINGGAASAVRSRLSEEEEEEDEANTTITTTSASELGEESSSVASGHIGVGGAGFAGDSCGMSEETSSQTSSSTSSSNIITASASKLANPPQPVDL